MHLVRVGGRIINLDLMQTAEIYATEVHVVFSQVRDSRTSDLLTHECESFKGSQAEYLRGVLEELLTNAMPDADELAAALVPIK